MAQVKLSDLGQEIFESRYAYPGETKWADRAKVIAKTVASAERDDDKEKIEKMFYESIGSGDLIPGGRIIFGAGRNRGHHNLLNCYVIIPEDDVDSIGQTVSRHV
jgi:ribonucleoside-diphosphate reductase alpha chain